MNIMGNEKCSRTIETVVNTEKCTGCMACYNVCPVQAISIEEKKNTFFYPKVDMDKCIGCKMCLNICPSIQEYSGIDNTFCYAIQTDDEIRAVSSSGGIFSIVAEWVIEQGGVVCGAAFEDGIVKHIAIDSLDNLYRLRKSKYIQSDCSTIYESIGKALNDKRLVLFVGTPCQCAGVRNVFSNYECLYLIDILCMGVPSQKMFDNYLKEEMSDDDVGEFDFRNKDRGGWTQNLVLSFKRNGKQEYIENRDCSFYSSFLNAYSIRESCATCTFAGAKRIGDLTIGDFWGIEFVNPQLNDKKGTNLVLVNSQKGEKIVNAVFQKLKIFEKYDIAIAERFNPIIKYPTMVSSKRREFVEELGDLTTNDKFKYLDKNTADCGIINYWWCNDNGAILTAFALQKLLSINGISSRLINICEGNQLEQRSRGISAEFERKYLYSTEQVSSAEQFYKLNSAFRNFIVGSDQVFRAEWVSNRWFLDFVELNKNKIAVSASFGIGELAVSKRREREVRYLLSRFNSISIREKSGIRLCNRLGVDAEYVIDPVFLLNLEYYLEIANSTKNSECNKDYIFVYFRDKTDEKLENVKFISDRLKLDYYLADDSTSVEVFLNRISNAKAVVTDSYHGLCFSLIFNRNYACYYNELRGNERFETLIQVLQIKREKFVNESQEVLSALLCEEDWDTVNSNICVQRENGVKWILYAINNPREINNNALRRNYVINIIGKARHKILRKLMYNRITSKGHIILKNIKRRSIPVIHK